MTSERQLAAGLIPPAARVPQNDFRRYEPNSRADPFESLARSPWYRCQSVPPETIPVPRQYHGSTTSGPRCPTSARIGRR